MKLIAGLMMALIGDEPQMGRMRMIRIRVP